MIHIEKGVLQYQRSTIPRIVVSTKRITAFSNDEQITDRTISQSRHTNYAHL